MDGHAKLLIEEIRMLEARTAQLERELTHPCAEIDVHHGQQGRSHTA
jgi:hypothetical protein